MPPGEVTHWTAAAMARLQGISFSSVQRIWRRHGLQPHRTRHFKLSTDAALNVLDGKVIGRCMPKHRHQDYISILNAADATVPTGKYVHAIVDNHATHEHPMVREWLEAHPWWTFHFTPTSASWLNAVEGYFAKLTMRRLARGY